MSLMDIQLKISRFMNPEDWENEDDDILVEKMSDTDGGPERLAHLDADSGGDRKSSESPGSDTSSP